MATPTSRRHQNYYYNGRQAHGYRPQGPRGGGGGPNQPHPHAQAAHPHPAVGVSASVGHDNWASDVIRAVVSKGPGSGPDSPESSHSAGSHAHDPKCSMDPSVLIAQKVMNKKRKFHSGRPLELKNLPEGCNEQDIRDAFPDLNVFSVTLEHNDGRYKASARLFLENPEILDDWPESRQNAFVKNKEVSVCVGNSDGWLCVAKLPLDYTEEEFYTLASAYGKVREAFVMISERTGESKGYGLIKYVSSDAAAQACHLLDGRTVSSANNPHQLYALDCDWLNSGHTCFKSLHSKALYVDHLPTNYRDMGEFRRIFSVFKSPPYCQIAMPKGVIQDWGLVEFFDPIDTETTQASRNGYLIRGRPIRVHFCIPGVNAINIYMQAVNAPPDPRKKALLQDTPSADVYTQLQKLASQNPAFAENLQNIIQEQIRSLSSGQSLLPSATSNREYKENSSKSAKTHGTQIQQQQQQQQQQQNHQQQQQQTMQHQPNQQATTTVVAAAPTLNANAQAALMILLTAQMQSQTGEASILQNPQVVGILQNLVNQAGDPTKQCDSNVTEILNDPALSSIFRTGGSLGATVPAQAPQWNQQPPTENVGRYALLETPKPPRPILLGDAPPGYAPVKSTPVSKDTSPTPPMVANNLNNLLNAQNLNQLLGSLTDAKPEAEKPVETVKPPVRRPPGPRPVLLGDPPGLPTSVSQGLPSSLASNGTGLSSNMVYTFAPPQVTSSYQVSTQMPPPPTYVQPQLSSVYTTMTSTQPQQMMATLFQSDPQLTMTNGYFQAAQQQQQQLVANPFLLASYANLAASSPLLTTAPPGHPPPSLQQQFLYPTSAYAAANASAYQSTNSLGYGPSPAVLANLPGYSLASSPFSPGQLMPPPVSSLLNSMTTTPPTMKRKLPIPPSPEASPEGPYIGQHSQGIGGHYADSYWRQKRSKNDNFL